jgi:CRISPR-associated DxTHG motif protein
MRKIITFLGTRPVSTTYQINDQRYTGSVFAEALRQFTGYDEMLVFLTEEAKEATWPVLDRLHDDRIKPITIPIGKNNDEMWVTFDKILDCVNEGDTVIFDITHGLRSTPFLMFLFAAFLKSAWGVRIEAVYYGAFELGSPKDNKPAPVFDLSEFVNMLDWLTATDRFIIAGDGQALTTLLQNEMPPGIHMGGDQATRDIGNHLRKAADSIEGISQALRMVRPTEALQASFTFTNNFSESKEVLEVTARPFAALAEKIMDSYGQFALDNALVPDQAALCLERHLKMIGWYLEHQQAVQATLLMREWLVSLLMAITNDFPFDNLEKRLLTEAVYNNGAQILMSKHHDKRERLNILLQHYPDPVIVIQKWQQLSQMRNDIAHCGLRENSRPASRLVQAASDIYQDLQQIANQVLPLIKTEDTT